MVAHRECPSLRAPREPGVRAEHPCSPIHTLNHWAHPPVNLDLILRWGGWPRRQGAGHTILFLLALAQKVPSATFPALSTSRYFTKQRWGWGGGSEGKGRKEGRRKEEGRKTTPPEAFCWYAWLQLCISNIRYTWLQLGPWVSSVSMYLPFTHAINCVFFHHASTGNHQLSPRDKLNQVLWAFFHFSYHEDWHISEVQASVRYVTTSRDAAECTPRIMPLRAHWRHL